MISTKGICAIHFMIDLAQQPQDRPIPLDEIAERQSISKKYLEIVVKDLVKGKLVKGISGKGGGYHLTRGADEYTVGEILTLTEGTLAPVACMAEDADKCPIAPGCRTMPMWNRFGRVVRDFFFGITIADLAEGKIEP